MNIALTTILLLLFLLPGMVLRRFYFTEEFSKQYFKQSFFELFISSFIPSIVIHTLVGWGISKLGYQIDFETIGQLVTGDQSEIAFQKIQSHIGNIVIYHAVALSLGALGGYLGKKTVRFFQLDSKHKIFRFQNHWHYILTGEFFNFKRAAFDLVEDTVEEIDFVHLDILVNTSDGLLIYDGFFVDYELNPTGGLENITLKNVQRRFVKDDDSRGDGVHYIIPGHILVVPYSAILNMNFSYYRFVPLENEPGKIELGIELVR